MGLFDKILADVPCTCEGTCRKDPDISNRVNDSSHERMARRQQAILNKAVQLCRPGGRIVYATCTFAPEENEAVVDQILQQYHGRVRLVPAQIPGFECAPGVTEWQGQTFDPSLALALRAWPQQNDTGGFFMALLERLPDVEMVVEENGCLETAVALYPELEQRQPWLDQITTRFGIAPDVFAEYDILRWSKRGIWIINTDNRPVQTPQPDSVGMTFIRAKGKYPKLTTASSLLFGQHATKNLIDLDKEQLMAYYGREEFPVSADQMTECSEGSGYVMVRFQGFPIGIGVYRQTKGTLESAFPKGWSRLNIQL
jgi:NOL1/NOP2/fmu family ribosome biogenesis protein